MANQKPEMSESHRIAKDIHDLLPDHMRGTNNRILTQAIGVAVERAIQRTIETEMALARGYTIDGHI